MGGDAASLVAKLRELEARQHSLGVEVARLQPVPRLAPVIIETRLAEWRRLLRQSTTQGRTVLQRVLRGRLIFTPRVDGLGYDFEGPTRFDKLFTGIAVGSTATRADRPSFVEPGDVTGTEGITSDDTWDGDYGRLLERAYGKLERTYGKGLVRPAGLDHIRGEPRGEPRCVRWTAGRSQPNDVSFLRHR